MVTPVRRQYLDLKQRHPDAILFFRLGDFYETFDEDARLVADVLDIQLTSKPMGGGLRSPLAGVPVRSVDQHLARLVQAGHRVAICEQLEDPRAARAPGAGRSLVKRGVVRVVSPGTALEPELLEAGQASACAALRLTADGRRQRLGLAAADISTGQCHTAQLESELPRGADAGAALELERELWSRAGSLLERLGARELVLSADAAAPPVELAELAGVTVTRRPEHLFRAPEAERAVRAQWGAPPAAFGLEQRPAALSALGALAGYLRESLPLAEDERADPAEGRPQPERQPQGAPPLGPPRWLDTAQRVEWDAATQRALALTDAGPPAGGGGRGGAGGRAQPRTLLEVIDRCRTAPGRRWLRAALSAPLLDLARIEQRLDRVEALVRRPQLRGPLTERLRQVPDLERLFARAASSLAQPPELAALARGLTAAAALADITAAALPPERDDAGSGDPPDPARALADLARRLAPAPEPAARLASALSDAPAADYGTGVVAPGVDDAVDRARAAVDAAHRALAERESTLKRETGLASLRVHYHRTFGYQIELPRAQARRAPEGWERRQSLRDRERFTEPVLRELERRLEAAEDDWDEAERRVVEELRLALAREAPRVREIAGAAARLDAALALAQAAVERGWTRPQLDHSGELELEGARHPIVEAARPQGAFVPNDLRLADDGVRAPQLLLVTGPNMAGKSTYLRQAALVVVLAQMGSFTPAQRARVGLVDRIFARVGAHDDLAEGRSTFMVEMLETARLLSGATERSLVLLDEIGRGTSTWDGLAIAQAVAETLAGGQPCAARRAPGRGPRTLFATHFHELTALAGRLERVANASVQVDERPQGGLAFRYEVAPGAADRSYGVQVAAQAGLPPGVVARAAELLRELEGGPEGAAQRPAAAQAQAPPQLMLMPPPADPPMIAPSPAEPILEDLAALDVDGITPLEAISALYALRDQARSELRARRPRQSGEAPEGPPAAAEAGS